MSVDDAVCVEPSPPSVPSEERAGTHVPPAAAGDGRLAQLEEALRRSEARLAETQRIARVGSWELDPAAHVFTGSPEAFRLLGLGAEGGRCALRDVRAAIAPSERVIFDRVLARARTPRPGRFVREFHLAGPAGRIVQFTGEVVRAPTPDGMAPPDVATRAGATAGVALWTGTVQDVTEAVASREQIRTLAYFDPLTGLPNRRQFVEQVRGALSHARRTGHRLALMVVDLDHFKRINDTHGHAAGDEVLRVVGHRLQHAVRDYDAVGRERAPSLTSSVARMGGDEFLLSIVDLERGDQAASVAQRLLAALAAPVPLADGAHDVSASIGISVYPEDGDTFDALLKHADVALYQAKDAGRNAYAFYDRRMSEAALQRLALESSLRQAIAHDALSVAIQPKVDGESGALLGGEALLRWTDPVMGHVPPAVFVAIAERVGLAAELAQFGFRTVCRQLVAWRDAGLPLVPMAINVSPHVFRDPATVASLTDIPAACGIAPSLLELEITETTLIDDPERAQAVFTSLRAAGFRIALDDFGTGFSSLSHLRRFRLDTIKIDRSFVRELQRNPRDAAIVRTLVDLADSLGLTPIAEGVEHDAQRTLLLSLGCRVMQGYLFGRPASVEEFTARLSAMQPSGTATRP
jgi:diguanylate cyclase (GGDEF)-like protein